MRSARVPRDDRRMATEHGEVRLILCIDLDADPITGSLTSASGATRRFSGWIALAAALATMRAKMMPRPAGGPPKDT